MLVIGGVGITLLAGLVAYGWMFARRPQGQRLGYSLLMMVLTPVLLYALMAVVVGLTFQR